MKRISLLFALAALMIASCTKPKPESRIYTTTDSSNSSTVEDTSFYIADLGDISIERLGISSVSFSVVHTNGIQKNVELSISGLPEKVTAEFLKIKGYTPFNTALEFDARFANAGKYPITITATPDKGEKKIYTISLNIEPFTEKECNNRFYAGGGSIALYPATYNMQDKEIHTNTRIFKNTISGKLTLFNVMLSHNPNAYSFVSPNNTSSSDYVVMNFSCDNGTFTIPEQTIRAYRTNPKDTVDFKISGSGQLDLDDNKYHITYATDSGTYKLVGWYSYK